MNENQRCLFDLGMAVLDSNYAPPLMWKNAKLSMWYAVGLLARNGDGDALRANKLIRNAMTQQVVDEGFEQDYGSFKKAFHMPSSSENGALWVGEIYDAYDPNNALFFSMGAMMIDALYSHLLEPGVQTSMRKAMHVACMGNSKRFGGFHGDDMRPSYTNPWILRCACSLYTGTIMKDAHLVDLANSWTQETVDLFDLYDTPGEFNSPTYAGVTLAALALAQYCPSDSVLAIHAPRMIQEIWISIGEVYNPSLLNVAGPWDRAYGYCMTQYYSTVGANIASVTGLSVPYPMPQALDGSEHYTDCALIPIQAITNPYTESFMPDEVRSKLFKLYAPHIYTPRSIFPPHDKSPRKYTFWLEDGLSAGGIEFDEDGVGGPKGIDIQFHPGVIQWDSGKHGGGVGWLSVWPENACCSIVASPGTLGITYKTPVDFPNSPRSNKLSLRIGCLPFMTLGRDLFADGTASLPGLDLALKGTFLEGTRTVTFSLKSKLHGAHFYEVTFDLGKDDVSEPNLVIEFVKTAPPPYDLVF